MSPTISCSSVYKIFGNNAKTLLSESGGNVDAKKFQEAGCIVGVNNASFDVNQGEIVALVGPTGAGKTTICNLIPRFWDPDIGCVKVGGYEVNNLNLRFLRGNIAAVLQDVFLFHGTVRHNILFGRPESSEEEVISAAQIANAE